ncbi:MAG: DUF1189 domain-containing protein [Planctomycetes bacterium]|nr:DUF1189 domain-containing protein [Planctomycetota bacterium]
MRRFGLFSGLLLALGSREFYADVGRRWRGIGVLYLLLLFALCWIPALQHEQNSFARLVDQSLRPALEDFPTIAIKDGKASSPAPQPYVMKDPPSGRLIFMLDTTGDATHLTGEAPAILLTEEYLCLQTDGHPQIHHLSTLPDMTITRETILGWLDFIASWLALIVFPFCLIGSLIRALVVMLLSALIGLVLCPTSKVGLGFGARLRLAAMGMTAPLYLDTLLTILGVTLPYWFLLNLAVTTAYGAFGAVATAQVAGMGRWSGQAEPPREAHP